MSVRLKIILIVLPLIITTLLIAGYISALSAESGITRVAVEFLGFKAQELRKYADNQWNLLVTNNLSAEEEYIQISKQALESYAGTIVGSETELIFAINEKGILTMSTTEFSPLPSERKKMSLFYEDHIDGWIEFSLEGSPRVAQSFYFQPFDWQIFVTEEYSSFYKEINEIYRQTAIILGISAVVAVLLLLIFLRIIMTPLSKMVTAMRHIISANDLSSRVDVIFKDEIGNLAQTFNIMVGELEKAYNQIKEFALKSVLSQRNEKKIRQIFQKYVPKNVIDKFFQNPESMLVGENRELAVLFSDIRSFTTISEGLMPEELVLSLNRYFSLMVDIIMDHNGIVDKYIGDAVMAFFGAPVHTKTDALNSVLTALSMGETLDVFNKEQREKDKPEFKIGIGINYGTVTVGNIGSEKKMDYTVIGDMVNLASRLEGLTKTYRQLIIFSESVYHEVKKTVWCRMLGKVMVKGKTSGERIFTAQRSIEDRTRLAWKYHHQGLDAYYKFDFEAAAELFGQTLKLLPRDYIAEDYLERCKQYILNPPPPDWNGTEIMTEK
jgi:adenylate cyclase